MSADFEAIEEKLKRAREHLKLFEDETETYFHECGNVMEIEVNPKTNRMALCLTIAKPIPPRLGIIVGDCVHNARSALDNLICALVRIDEPASTCFGRQYPAFTKPADYRNVRDKILKGVPDEAKRLIDEFNPSAGPDVQTPRTLHAVAIINTLSNRDKHRAPHLTAAYSRRTEFTARLPEGNWILRLTGSLYANTHMEIPFQPGLLKHRDRVECSSLLNIHFHDRTMFGEEPVLSLLTFSLDFVQKTIVPSFKPFFYK